jgi:lysophospholipase L1-like esterase
MSRRTLLSAAAFALWALAVLPPVQAGSLTYIALGDSNTFGETDFTHNPSYGDRGFVAPVADFLATLNGGVRPNVINLAVDGETSTSFFQGGKPGETDPLANLNYTVPTATQNDLFLGHVAAEEAAGRTVSLVTFSLGTNELNELAATPGLLNLPFSQQVALVAQTLGIVQANETKFLTEFRTLLPDTQLILFGVWNPYAAIPDSPLSGIAPLAVQALNQVIAGEAAAFGGSYVDVYTPFLGHEAAYTHILDPPAGSNGHANDLGYSVIADQIIAQAVPEPPSVILMAFGTVGLLVLYRRRPELSRPEVS